MASRSSCTQHGQFGTLFPAIPPFSWGEAALGEVLLGSDPSYPCLSAFNVVSEPRWRKRAVVFVELLVRFRHVS